MLIPAPTTAAQTIIDRQQSAPKASTTGQQDSFSDILATSVDSEQQSHPEMFLHEVFGKSGTESLSEEDLYASLVYGRIMEKFGEEEANNFKTEFTNQLESGRRGDGYAFVESSVLASIRKLVGSGTLTMEEAETINGEAFAAAQLDNNTEELWDNLGTTQAVAQVAGSLSTSAAMLERIHANEVSVEKRSLTASAPTPASADQLFQVLENSTASSTMTPETQISDTNSLSGSGVIWKPISEGDRKLAVILPSSGNPQISLYTPQGRYIESGNDTGLHSESDRRRVYRFDRPGADYPPGTLMKIGSTMYRIDNTASRYN